MAEVARKSVEGGERAEPGARADRPTRTQLVSAFAAVYVVWGSTYLAIRFAVETLPPFLMAGARFVVAGAVLYGWMRLRGTPRPRRVHWRSATVVGALLLLGGNGGVVWAEQFVASGLAALLVATVPLWMVALDWLLHGARRPGPSTWLGVAVGLAGVALLVDPLELSGSRPLHGPGAAVLLLASLSWTLGSLHARRAELPASQRLATGMEMLAGGALLLLAGLLLGEAGRLDPAGVSLRSALSLAYLVLFGSLIGFTAYLWLLRATTPARASTYAFVNPVIAVLLGWLFAAEPLTPRILVSAALIVGAVVLVSRERRRPEPRAVGPAR